VHLLDVQKSVLADLENVSGKGEQVPKEEKESYQKIRKEYGIYKDTL